MSTFKYWLIDGKEYLQDADYYELVEYTTINDRQESSIVVEYIFWKDGRDVWRIPALFVDKIREIG
jgi:hypothetical protein